MQNDIEKRIEEILGIRYVAPHVSPDGVKFDEPRCGDCFCTNQEIHTHSTHEEFVKPLLAVFESAKNTKQT